MDPRGRSVQAFTDGAGDFAVQVPSGLFRVRARPDQETNRVGAYWGDSFGFCPGLSVELEPDDLFDQALIELPEGGAIEGTVLDEQGLPLADAAVSASGLDFYNSGIVRSAISDAEGRFRIVGVDSVVVDGEPIPGHYLLDVRSPGEATWFLPGSWDRDQGEPVETSRGATVELEPALRPEPTSISGSVLGADGEALEGATAELYAGQGGVLLVEQTGPDGTFAFERVGGTDLGLTVSAVGHARYELDEPLRPEPGEELALEPVDLAPEGRLEGGITGLEPPGGTLQLEDETGAAFARHALGGGEVVFELEQLPAGSWTLRFVPAAASDLQPQSLPVVLVAEETAVVDLELVPGAAVRGSARRRGGEVMAGVEVTALTPDSGEELPRGRTHTDGDGVFALRGLPQGEALVRLAWRPYCSSDPTWVETWFPDGRHELEAVPVALEAEAEVDVGELLLPPDRDTDGMDDIWELVWGLDRGRADGSADPDGDGRTNLQEFLDRTDPLELDRGSGCRLGGSTGRARASTLVFLLLAVWLTRRRAGATIPPRRQPARAGSRRPRCT